MFKNIEEATQFILSLYKEKASLETYKSVFKKYDNFQKKLKVIHITGTNGKGSTSKMVNDILIKNHYKVGLFTSPHIIKVNDRIKINNQSISDKSLLKYLNYFYKDIIENKLNFFQAYFLIASKYFYDSNVDVNVIEVGIGGRLDATNVVDGMISVITSISFDHTNKLGNTIEEIAYEKAGIIKDNNFSVVNVNSDQAFKVIKSKALKHKSQLVRVKVDKYELINKQFHFKFDNQAYILNTNAKYQINNAYTTLNIIKILIEYFNFKITYENVYTSLLNFSWLGRFEKINDSPEIIIDGAHNISGIKALIDSSKDDNYVVVFSALFEKDYHHMLDLLIENYQEVVFSEFEFNKALKSSDLNSYDIEKFSDFKISLDYLTSKYPNSKILVCGSLYFISYVRGLFIKEEL